MRGLIKKVFGLCMVGGCHAVRVKGLWCRKHVCKMNGCDAVAVRFATDGNILSACIEHGDCLKIPGSNGWSTVINSEDKFPY